MKMAFSTLACPSWSWQKAIEAARSLGYEGVEWRLIDGNLVDDTFPLETCRAIQEAMRKAGLTSCALDTDIRLAISPGSEQESRIEKTRSMIKRAEALGVGFMRVFNGELPEGIDEEKAFPWIVSVLEAVVPDAERSGVKLAVEVHTFEGRGKTGITDSLLCRKVADKLDSPAVGILWDVGNSLMEGETLAQAWDHVRGYLLYLHLKDFKRLSNGGWSYVASGEGELPFPAVLDLLRGSGFEGWLSFEWEKKWHPELAEPEASLPQHIRWLQGLLKKK